MNRALCLVYRRRAGLDPQPWASETLNLNHRHSGWLSVHRQGSLEGSKEPGVIQRSLEGSRMGAVALVSGEALAGV